MNRICSHTASSLLGRAIVCRRRSSLLFCGVRHRPSGKCASCMSSLSGDVFFLDEFAFRQFKGGHAAQINCPKEEFVQRVHDLYNEVCEVLVAYCPQQEAGWLLSPLTTCRCRGGVFPMAMHHSASISLSPTSPMQH